jgi:hypothetical protein
LDVKGSGNVYADIVYGASGGVSLPSRRAFDQVEQVAFGIGKEEDATAAAGRFDRFFKRNAF